jgi:hypothetical protein
MAGKHFAFSSGEKVVNGEKSGKKMEKHSGRIQLDTRDMCNGFWHEINN